MRHITRLAAAALVLTIGVACGDQTTNPDTTQVSVVDNAFNPPSNTIMAGQTVTWTWNGNAAHNVTFDDASIGNSSTQSSGTFQKTFTQPGDYTYYCTIHGRSVMSGKVTVQ